MLDKGSEKILKSKAPTANHIFEVGHNNSLINSIRKDVLNWCESATNKSSGTINEAGLGVCGVGGFINYPVLWVIFVIWTFQLLNSFIFLFTHVIMCIPCSSVVSDCTHVNPLPHHTHAHTHSFVSLSLLR